MHTLCLATNNKGKISELQLLLSGLPIQLVSLASIGCTADLPETHETFAENSAQKAWYVHQNYNVNCMADDSGLCVEALNGRPGVYSARYAGTHGNDAANIEKVLHEMAGIEQRNAYFETVITLVWKGQSVQFSGRVHGTLATQAMGNNGFGYDPIFVPDGYTQTFGELSLEVKKSISHRAIAVSECVKYLKQFF